MFSRWFWAVLLLAAGLAHFVKFDFFWAYYPSYLPFATLAVLGTGLLELGLAGRLIFARELRGTWLVIALLMTIYLTVHVYVITDHHLIKHPDLMIPLWLAWWRLPIQLIFIGWPAALFFWSQVERNITFDSARQ